MGKYTEQIERLTQDPDEIQHDWARGEGLFKFANNGTVTGGRRCNNSSITAGCLTMIRESPQCYGVIINNRVDEALTLTIACDLRLPVDENDITPEDLPVFEYYQELIDQKIAELP